MSTVNVDFGGWIQAAFDLYKKNFVTLLLANLIASLIAGLTFFILAGPLAVGLFMVTLGLLDGASPAPQPGDVFKGFKSFLPAFVVVLVVMLVSMIASFLIPVVGNLVGLVISTFVMFSLPMLADGRTDNLSELLSRSFDMVKANFWPLLGLNLVAALLAGVGVILCGIGAIVTAPMYACIIAVAYRAHVPAGGGTAPMKAPPLA